MVPTVPTRASIVVLSLLALLLSQAALAEAKTRPIKYCGHWGWIDELEDVGWTYNRDEISGAGTFNVRTTGRDCSAARRLARNGVPGKSYRGWDCQYVSRRHEFSSTRCTRPSGTVVRFVTAS